MKNYEKFLVKVALTKNDNEKHEIEMKKKEINCKERHCSRTKKVLWTKRRCFDTKFWVSSMQSLHWNPPKISNYSMTSVLSTPMSERQSEWSSALEAEKQKYFSKRISNQIVPEGVILSSEKAKLITQVKQPICYS